METPTENKIDKTQNYLQDGKLLKQLIPICRKQSLEPDAKYVFSSGKGTGIYLTQADIDKTEINKPYSTMDTFLSSSLELLLPEWCYTGTGMFPDEQWLLVEDIYHLTKDALKSRGKQKVENIARLIILLDENDLLEVKHRTLKQVITEESKDPEFAKLLEKEREINKNETP